MPRVVPGSAVALRQVRVVIAGGPPNAGRRWRRAFANLSCVRLAPWRWSALELLAEELL